MSEELWDQSYAHTKRINRLAERVNQLEKENTLLATRIERLEAIISSMGAGSESSPPDDGNGHTHWSYPLNGAKDLVDEIEGEYAAERETGGKYDTPPLCINEHTDLADFDEYEAKEAGWPERLIRDALHEIQRREDENYGPRNDEKPSRCPRCGQPISWERPRNIGTDLCRECESDLAEEQATLGADWDLEMVEEQGCEHRG